MAVNLLACFWIILMIFSVSHGALAIKKGYYTIVSPARVQPGSDFHVSLTLNDFHKPCWFNISLTTFVKHETIQAFESIEVEPGTTKLVKFQAPAYDRSIANLDVIGFRGIISQDSAHIYFHSNKLFTFIQTNKDKYRPGELVQIRVICIDELTRPAKLNERVDVEIYDGQYNLVKGIFDVEFVQGVFKTELQISKQAVLGLWKINVNGRSIYTGKHFEVERYVLPKFDVQVEAKIVRIDKVQLEVEVRARYFYGEPVKGNLTVNLINTAVPIAQFGSNLPTSTQESRIDGKTTILFDLESYISRISDKKYKLEHLTAYSRSPSAYQFSIEANVIDDLSQEQSSAETDQSIYETPFVLELEAPKQFYTDEILKFKVKVVMRDVTDAVIQNPTAPIEVVLGCGHVEGYNRNLINFDTIRAQYKHEAGQDFGVVNMTNKDYNECFVYAEYQGIKSSTEQIYKKSKVFEINVLTERPKEGNKMEIQISNPEPLEEFSYEIISKGDIIQSARVVVPGNQTSHILRLNVTSSMVPKITIYAHHIKDMSFGGQLKDVAIEKSLKNSIVIQTAKEAKPGTPVGINVTTDPGSYVGLMGLDRSALQNIIKENFFDEDFVNDKLKTVISERGYPVPLYGVTVNVITFSNVFPPGGRENGPGGDDEPAGGGEVARVRNLFPDSWLFKDFERAPEGGLHFMETTPDSITTWALTGFSLHPETGLTFTKNITDLRVFQKFFVSMDLPSLVKEGEIIEVPVYISNYMNQDVLANLTIESNRDGDLNISESPESSSKPKQNVSKLISQKKRDKIIFFIKPLIPGPYNITVTAFSPEASDAIQKTLQVQPQGITYEMSKTSLVHLPKESSQKDEITIDIPENAIPGSQKVEVSVVGDIFRPLVKNLQKLAGVPYGNSEENVRLFVTNSIVLKYLKALNYLDPSVESKMKLNLELGYQNEMSFKYLDGSFGLFERKNERTGDIWQTIFALWGLKYAEDLISVDSKVINRGLDYLKSKQQQNGCFGSEGEATEEKAKFTAFGLMVFLMDDADNSQKEYNDVIAKGLAYLYEVSDDLEYSPISVVSAYVLHLGKHEKAADLLKRLASNTTSKAKQMLWTKSDSIQSHLETIAGSLLSLFEAQEIPEQSILHIVRGLVASKMEDSSVTHMVALQAMVSFAEKLFLTKTNLDISFNDDRNYSGSFHLNDENAEVLQKFELDQSSGRINIQSKGSGFAMVDVKYEYNLLPEQQSSIFHIGNISVEIYSDFLIYVPICVTVLSNDTQNKFIVMEVSLQSGYVFTDGDYNNIDSQNDDIKAIQYNDERGKAVIYFEYEPANETCIELEARKTYRVINSQPGWVIVYGERDKDRKSISSFMVDES